MERVTKREANGLLNTTNGQSIYACLVRLAELEDMFNNGKLVELPCKIGDTVYVVVRDLRDYVIIQGHCVGFEINDSGVRIVDKCMLLR